MFFFFFFFSSRRRHTRLQGDWSSDVCSSDLMSRVHRALHESDLHARVLLQVHDELVAEVPRLEVDRMAQLLRDEMSAAYLLDVSLVVDVRAGPNWDEMQRLEVAAAA